MTGSIWPAVLLATLLLGWAAPVAVHAAPSSVPIADDDDDDRGRRGGERAQREADRARRAVERAQRAAEEALRDAQRAAQREWRDQVNFGWDANRPWIQQRVQIPAGGQSLPVIVLIPPTGTQPFLPNVANTLQTGVLPPLLQAVPPEAFAQTPLQFWQVQPNAFGLAHPALYWGADDFPAAQQFVAQLGSPGFQPMALQGPLGYGTYLVVVPW
jgi:hypothetical protein